MRTKLVPVASGRGIVIDEKILDFIGAASVEDWELTTTDGHSLLLEPLRVQVVRRTEQPPNSPQPAPLGRVDCEDPKESVRALHVAQSLGFTQDHFRSIHHFGPKASIQAHINHCIGTGRFTSKTNVIVCQRLVRAVELREQGADWDSAVAAATAEFPFPNRR